ncbi:MAG: endonuclease III [Acidobacteriota bacterium]
MNAAPNRDRQYAAAIDAELAAAYPAATCELGFRDAYQLAVATILSAQCTDVRVNQVTPRFFAHFPNARALARAEQGEIEKLIRSTGFYRNKARSLLGMAQAVVERYAGEIPGDMDALLTLPGFGRKTANVVLGTAFGIAAGVVVDTHVTRLSRRLGLTRQADPEKIERDLIELFPPSSWVALSHRLVLHGRRVCRARRPACAECALVGLCPKVGL